MSKRFKDFGSGTDINREEIVFRLYNEEFRCLPSLPGRTLLGLVASTSDTDNAGQISASIEKFFDSCLLPDSRDRFFALIDDPERVVSVEMLGEITAWLIEEYSGRPTKGSED